MASRSVLSRAGQYNEPFHTVISADSRGLVEYWDPTTFEHPATVSFQFKTDTDLYEFAKVRNGGVKEPSGLAAT